ncbi:MAG: hypothetical protein UZ16_OP3001000036 [Candidatus Hinthialibacteria bacterium OLB16]|nr:MAG: hypothetical protein UZ16_OP3001000036 [Candidatus Hinthialibacteria bacterium OLB16]
MLALHALTRKSNAAHRSPGSSPTKTLSCGSSPALSLNSATNGNPVISISTSRRPTPTSPSDLSTFTERGLLSLAISTVSVDQVGSDVGTPPPFQPIAGTAFSNRCASMARHWWICTLRRALSSGSNSLHFKESQGVRASPAPPFTTSALAEAIEESAPSSEQN